MVVVKCVIILKKSWSRGKINTYSFIVPFDSGVIDIYSMNRTYKWYIDSVQEFKQGVTSVSSSNNTDEMKYNSQIRGALYQFCENDTDEMKYNSQNTRCIIPIL